MSLPSSGQRLSQTRILNEAGSKQTIQLLKVQVYMGNHGGGGTARKLSVPTGLLTEQSEPTGVQGNTPVSIGSLTE
jgi:hypothetical protein